MNTMKLFQIDVKVSGERRAMAVAARTMEEAIGAVPDTIANLEPGASIEMLAVHACGDVHIHVGVRQ